MAFVLLLVRHAEALHNVQGYDHTTEHRTDPPLTERGQKQTEALAGWLVAHHADCAALYSSDQMRALQTAEPIGEALGLRVERDHRLRDFGACRDDGSPYPLEEIPQRVSDVVVKEMPFASITDHPQGESFFDLLTRSGQFLAMLMQTYRSGEQVAVVTHSGPVNALPMLTLGMGLHSNAALWLANGSLSVLRYDPDTVYEHWNIVSLGNTRHLSALD